VVNHVLFPLLLLLPSNSEFITNSDLDIAILVIVNTGRVFSGGLCIRLKVVCLCHDLVIQSVVIQQLHLVIHPKHHTFTLHHPVRVQRRVGLFLSIEVSPVSVDFYCFAPNAGPC